MTKLYFISALTLLLLVVNSFTAPAQAPEGFTYQAEARDAAGKLLTNKALTVKTTILKGSATDGFDVWDKNYTVTTDKYGLFSIVIGDAGSETGFSNIAWGEGKYFLNVQIKNGTTWLNTGTTQLLSVPYALYAKSAGSAKIKETDPVFTAAPAFTIGNSDISNWNTAYGWGNHNGLYRPVTWVPSWNEVGGKPFRIDDSPLNGDLLIWDGGIARFINWTPNFLKTETDPIYSVKFDLTSSASGDILKFDGSKYVKFTPNYLTSENDPVYSANFDLTNVVSGDFLKYNGTKFAKYSPDINQTNYNYGSKYGVKLQAQYGAQTNVDLVLSAKGYGAYILQQPDGGVAGGNNRGRNAVDLQSYRESSDQVAAGDYSLLAGGIGNKATGLTSAVVGGGCLYYNIPGNFYEFRGNTASGISSFVGGGISNNAEGDRSFIAGGSGNTATAKGSLVAGANNTAGSYYETVFGINATIAEGTPDHFSPTDRLFAIGNGTVSSPSNALTVLKNANTTIGGSLTINGNGTNTSLTFPTERGTNGQILSTDGSGGTSWATPNAGTVTNVSGTSPISVATGTSTPVISIAAATTSTAGSMSAADKTKLDGIPTLSIGQSYQGGIIFWLDDTGQHGLIAATADQGTSIQWYNGTNRYTGTTGDGLYAGAMNTAMIIATQMADNQTGNFAAKVCADYSVTVSGVTYGDWYLPSKYELNLLYAQKTAVGGFASANYWSSTEGGNDYAWGKYFGEGYQYESSKNFMYYVRAIRAF
jgi:hypothetical protein